MRKCGNVAIMKKKSETEKRQVQKSEVMKKEAAGNNEEKVKDIKKRQSAKAPSRKNKKCRGVGADKK